MQNIISQEMAMSDLYIENRDVELIRKAVCDPNKQQDLIKAYISFMELIARNESGDNNNETVITIYTDGLLIKNQKRGTCSMGCG